MGQYSQDELVLVIIGSLAAGASFLCTLAGTLELLVILGPVACCPTWWVHNLVLLLVWPAILGFAGSQLHGGWQPAVAFVVLGAVFTFTHMALLSFYWLRRKLRRQAAMELPTQQLLTEAHRMMLAGAVDAPVWGVPYVVDPTSQAMSTGDPAAGQHTGDAACLSNRFQLQVGRTDGVAGYTLFIPAEAEDAAIAEAAARYQQQQQQLEQEQQQRRSPTRDSRTGSLRDSLRESFKASSVKEAILNTVPISPSLRALGGGSKQGGAVPSTPLPQTRSGSLARSLPVGVDDTASCADATPSRSSKRSVVHLLVPEHMPRWAASSRASLRYKAWEAGSLSPGSSAKRRPDNTSSYVPPAPEEGPVGDAEQGLAGAQQQQQQQQVGRGLTASPGGTGRQEPQGAHMVLQPMQVQASSVAPLRDEGLVEGSNPLLANEFSLSHLALTRSTSARSQGQSHSRTPSGREVPEGYLGGPVAAAGPGVGASGASAAALHQRSGSLSFRPPLSGPSMTSMGQSGQPSSPAPGSPLSQATFLSRPSMDQAGPSQLNLNSFITTSSTLTPGGTPGQGLHGYSTDASTMEERQGSGVVLMDGDTNSSSRPVDDLLASAVITPRQGSAKLHIQTKGSSHSPVVTMGGTGGTEVGTPPQYTAPRSPSTDKRQGRGLGRLSKSKHHRTHSFPSTSPLTAALLDTKDNSSKAT